MRIGRAIWVSSLLCLASSNTGYALPLAIEVLETRHSVSLTTTIFNLVGGGTPTTASRTTEAFTPVADYLSAQLEFAPGWVTSGEASAAANLFDLSVETSGQLYGRATALASTEITFTPFESTFGLLELDLAGWDQFYFSEGHFSLFDVTANQNAWTYGWGLLLRGNVPWQQPFSNDPALPTSTASLAVNTFFLSGHIYKLTMSAKVGADSDSQRIIMQVSGLQPTAVPEPSSLLLLGFGLATLGGAASKVRHWGVTREWLRVECLKNIRANRPI